MKYKCGNIIVDAAKYDGDFMDSSAKYYMPKWAVDALESGTIYYDEYYGVPAELFIKMPEGEPVHVNVGNYIVKFDTGEISTCAEKLFEELFKPFKPAEV